MPLDNDQINHLKVVVQDELKTIHSKLDDIDEAISDQNLIIVQYKTLFESYKSILDNLVKVAGFITLLGTISTVVVAALKVKGII